MKRRTHREQSARCKCMGGPDRAKEHAKPGVSVAEHGNVWTHTGACIHSELSNTTKAERKQPTVQRLRIP